MRIVILFIAVSGLSACQDHFSETSDNRIHYYEDAGSFKFQTFADEAAVYDVALEIVPLAGYQLVTDMRESVSEDGASLGGLHFRKEGRKQLLTFSPTVGINCYFFSVSAYDKEEAMKVRNDLPLLQKELKNLLGPELRYMGSEECPSIYPTSGAQ